MTDENKPAEFNIIEAIENNSLRLANHYELETRAHLLAAKKASELYLKYIMLNTLFNGEEDNG